MDVRCTPTDRKCDCCAWRAVKFPRYMVLKTPFGEQSGNIYINTYVARPTYVPIIVVEPKTYIKYTISYNTGHRQTIHRLLLSWAHVTDLHLEASRSATRQHNLYSIPLHSQDSSTTPTYYNIHINSCTGISGAAIICYRALLYCVKTQLELFHVVMFKCMVTKVN